MLRGRAHINLVSELVELIHGLLVDVLKLPQLTRHFHQPVVELGFLEPFVPAYQKRP